MFFCNIYLYAATVVKCHGEFYLGPRPHHHPGQVSKSNATKVMAPVKKKAIGDLFKPAAAIVEDVLLNQLDDVPCPSIANPNSIARAMNRCRQSRRPDDPVDLEIEL